MVHVQVVAKTIDGRSSSMSVNSALAVSQLKEMLAAEFGISAEQQALLFANAQMANSKTLGDYCTAEEIHIAVVADIDGGAKKKKKVYSKPKKNKHKNKKIKMRALNLYKVEADGKVIHVRQECPVCGSAYFLAQHNNRLYCGNCHYTTDRQ